MVPGPMLWGAVLVFIPYLWLWISKNHLWISIDNYGYQITYGYT